MKQYPMLEEECTMTRSDYYSYTNESNGDPIVIDEDGRHTESCTCLACCDKNESKLIARRRCYWCHNSVMFCTCPDGFHLEEAQ